MQQIVRFFEKTMGKLQATTSPIFDRPTPSSRGGAEAPEPLHELLITRSVVRVHVGEHSLSPALTQIHPTAIDEFKNAYNIEFLGLPSEHSEADLHGALLQNLGRFLTELGRDLCFVGSQYLVQVGNQDFAIDLVFCHRGLQCLVAFELKTEKFKPTDLGQLSFYAEALGRDVKKPHERPSIGVLRCAEKDDEVVEYALARTMSPTLVAEYQTEGGAACEASRAVRAAFYV